MSDSSITRTASDALQAKTSAVWNGGYRFAHDDDDVYDACLQAFRGDEDVKRQTPLVHAGYALRIHAVLSVVRNFVSYHHDASNLQIILLGGGMDVTGLWAGQGFPDLMKCVIEVDLPTVCAAKQKMLRASALINFDDEGMTKSRVHRGNFAQHSSTRYALVELDLRQENTEWKSELEGLWDPQSPTLVISEVVLAYIGQEAIDRVLSSWANALKGHSTSCLILLEPLGQQKSENIQHNIPRPRNVLQNFQAAYTKMFHAKLERGVQKKAGLVEEEHVCSFAPIGSSPRQVARRLRSAQWPEVVAVSLAHVSPNLRTTNEPFDEHAALLLHAQSYVVACAFTCTERALFRRVVAPWQSTVAPVRVKNHQWIVTIDQSEEKVVKELFIDGYADLTRTNKSVHRLVQSTFKKDLILTEVGSDMEGMKFNSHFAKYYQDRGGCFWVAVDAKAQKITGFIALSKASPEAKGILGKHPHTFEVHRLYVVPEYRSQGVAGHLMDVLQQFALSRVPAGTTVTFVAYTLELLVSANRFYERRGFVLEEKLPLPEVMMLAYTLRLQKPTSVDAT